jgi:hypothetical protein
MPHDRVNALTVRIPAGQTARIRLPPCRTWQWGAWGLGAGNAQMSLEGPGFSPTGTGTLQTIVGPGGLSIVNNDPGPDVYVRFTSAQECQAIVLLDVRAPTSDGV